MMTYEYAGKIHRLYKEGEVIHGLPEENDIVLTRDGKQMIYEGRWNTLDIMQEDRDALMDILEGRSEKQVEAMFIVHPDPDKNRVREKLMVWDRNVENS